MDSGFHIVLVVGLLAIDAIDREDRIAISRAGNVGLVVFEADINAFLAE